MSIIKPFKAVYYNKSKVRDFAKVISPPYDVISPEEQDHLHNLSPYNFTHIDFGKEFPNDDKNNNRYTRAKDAYANWFAKKVLVKDDKPCIYFYRQEFRIMGQKNIRMGFIGLLGLDDGEESNVFPHENTHAKAVDDRFRICEALKSNLSSIFVCYSDRHRKVEKVFEKNVIPTEPLIDVRDEDKVHHKLWRLDGPDLIKLVTATVSGLQLFIADGHHRYKVAQEYRTKRMQRVMNPTGQESFNFVMTYFTNIDGRGLQIFPMHRIVKRMPKKTESLSEFFRIDKIKKKEDLRIILSRAGRNEHAFGYYSRDGIELLRLKNKLFIDKYVKEGSPDYKSLDAAILKSFVFDRFGIKSDDIQYTKNVSDVIHAVDEHRADAGFVMNPVKIDQLRSIALNGERMPPKTTYFYPKVLSGLTVYKMD